MRGSPMKRSMSSVPAAPTPECMPPVRSFISTPQSERSDRGWLLGANSNLPDDISVSWSMRVANAFHARFSATSRSYRYRILNRLERSALYRHRAWWVYQPLDSASMHEAAQRLLGRHDFSAFRAAGCQASTAVRDITSIAVRRDGDWLTLTVTANAFLQHMVRNIAGSLVCRRTGRTRPCMDARGT